MPTTYILKLTASDLTGGTDFNLLLAQATPGFNIQSVSVASNATEDSFGFTTVNDPSSTGVTGLFSVRVNVQTGNTNIQLSTSLQRINAAGIVQQTSAFSLEQTATAGTKTFNFPATNLGTWASGNRLRVTYRFRNTANMVQSCGITVDSGSEVDAPWAPPPFGGDDALFTDICGSDLVQINKWSQIGASLGGVSINAVDQAFTGLPNYGLCKIRKSPTNPTKLYYAYTPFVLGTEQAAITYGVYIGWIDTQTMVATQLVELRRRLNVSMHYWLDWFDVDADDNLYYIAGYVRQDDGVSGYQTNPDPTYANPTQGRLTKLDSAGNVLSDVCIMEPYQNNNPQPPGNVTMVCNLMGVITTPKWISLDGQYLYGWSPLFSGADELGGCGSVATGNITYRITVATGAVTYPIASFPIQTELANGLNPALMSYSRAVYYPDGSIAMPVFVVQNAGSSYVWVYRFSNNGTFLGYFRMTGLNAAIQAISGNVAGFAASLNTAGTMLFCRLNYNSDFPNDTLGRAKIYSTPYPFSASSVFTFRFDAYGILSQETCHWGEIEVNTGDRVLVSGLYANIEDTAAMAASLTPGEPPERRRPFVTLIGAN